MTVEGGESPARPVSLPLAPAEVKAGGRSFCWTIRGMRGQFGELRGRYQSIIFPLDLKAQLGFGDQRTEPCPVGGPVLGAQGKAGGKPRGARMACSPFASFSFQNEAGQPLDLAASPPCSPILKIGDLFLHTPQRGLSHWCCRTQGLLGILAPFQNHPSQQEHRTGGWAESLAFSYSSQRSLANLIPGKKTHQS